MPGEQQRTTEIAQTAAGPVTVTSYIAVSRGKGFSMSAAGLSETRRRSFQLQFVQQGGDVKTPPGVVRGVSAVPADRLAIGRHPASRRRTSG